MIQFFLHRSIILIQYKSLPPQMMHFKHPMGEPQNKKKLVGAFSVQDLGHISTEGNGLRADLSVQRYTLPAKLQAALGK